MRDHPQSSQRCDRFAQFAIVLKKRGRSSWKWAVLDPTGQAVMSGSEHTRAGARYKADRALFLLLCSSASRLSEAPLEDELLLRAETVILEARRCQRQSRSGIARLRRPREALSENIEKLRSADEEIAAEAASARSFMMRASAKLDDAAAFRSAATKAPRAGS
ncbi:hypothetical protein BSN85_23910 [Bradyrhizobium brasilense]|nr:hypothetical protein BSN85_23910 [Bradyrhizobium brasilense]